MAKLTREQELQKIKRLMKINFTFAVGGLFDERNLNNDRMETLFKGKYFALDICYRSRYFELFGATEQEFKELEDYYNELESKYEDF